MLQFPFKSTSGKFSTCGAGRVFLKMTQWSGGWGGQLNQLCSLISWPDFPRRSQNMMQRGEADHETGSLSAKPGICSWRHSSSCIFNPRRAVLQSSLVIHNVFSNQVFLYVTLNLLVFWDSAQFFIGFSSKLSPSPPPQCSNMMYHRVIVSRICVCKAPIPHLFLASVLNWPWTVAFCWVPPGFTARLIMDSLGCLSLGVVTTMRLPARSQPVITDQ